MGRRAFGGMVGGVIDYELMMKEALRQVVARALTDASVHGLPGNHHFYVAFRTDFPGVQIPPYLKATYPEEMTIVLQHQFWDLRVHDDIGLINVSLSFGGVPANLAIPLAAVTGFADPHVRFGLRFRVGEPEPQAAAEPEPPPPPAIVEEAPQGTPQVVSLDAFRRRPTPKE